MGQIFMVVGLWSHGGGLFCVFELCWGVVHYLCEMLVTRVLLVCLRLVLGEGGSGVLAEV